MLNSYQLFPNSLVLKDHTKTIREAYLSYYSGYKTAAIAALIPIVESAINDFLNAESKSNLKLIERIDYVMDIAVKRATSIHYDHNWIAKEFTEVEHLKLVDERIYLFETLRRWLKNSFFSKTILRVDIKQYMLWRKGFRVGWQSCGAIMPHAMYPCSPQNPFWDS